MRELEHNIKTLEELCLKQQKEIEELKDFKKKIELGSYLIRCAAYAVGAVAIFVVSLFPYLERWLFHK